MKIEKKVNWITSAFKDQNPVFAKIKGFRQRQGAKGNEDILTVEINEKLFDWTIYGEQFNFLIDKLGDETDLWIDKRLKLLKATNAVTGKNVIKVEIIQN